MRNDQYSALLNRIADLLEIRGELFFKVRSYREAARQIDELGESVDAILAEGRIGQIPGVGKAISDKLADYMEHGKLEYLEKLERDIPPGLLDFLRIPGLGPRTAKDIYDALGITTLADLEAVVEDDRITKVPRLRAKSIDNIRKGLAALKGKGEGPRTLLPVAMNIVQQFVGALEKLEGVEQVLPAGSVRRRVETIGDLDIVVAARDAAPVMEAFCGLAYVGEVLARGETKSSIRTTDGMQVDLRVVVPEHFGAAMVYFTGSKAHNVRMRALALKQGLTLNEYGLAQLRFDEEGAEPAAAEPTEKAAPVRAGAKRSRAVLEAEPAHPSATEEEVYATLGMDWVPPVLREDRGEVQLALEHKLPRLLELSDLRGDLHCHSDNSDGKATIEEMLEAAVARGYGYLNITDHSRSQGIISGIPGETYRDQVARVRAAAAVMETRHPGFRVLCGVEVNVLPDGSLDVPDEILAELDVVVASVHSHFKQPRAEMTARICRAVLSPHVDILGHPTGRKLETRDPYEVDLDEVFKAALRGHTAVEINASPQRLDLSDIHARRARETGLKLSIGSDAHRTKELDQAGWGVYVAQRAWLQPDDILNCWEVDRLLAHVRTA